MNPNKPRAQTSCVSAPSAVKELGRLYATLTELQTSRDAEDDRVVLEFRKSIVIEDATCQKILNQTIPDESE